MATRVVDRYGRAYDTREVRRRMGFMGGDELDAEGGEPPTWDAPGHFEIPELRLTGDGFNDEPLAKRRGRP